MEKWGFLVVILSADHKKWIGLVWSILEQIWGSEDFKKLKKKWNELLLYIKTDREDGEDDDEEPEVPEDSIGNE